MFSRRNLLAAVALAPLAALSPVTPYAWADDDARARGSSIPPPTVDELLRSPFVPDVALSPDGTRIAVVNQEITDGKRATFILLGKADEPGAAPVKVSLQDYDVEQIEWANNDRLLLWLNFNWVSQMRWRDMEPEVARRLLSLSLDGKENVLMFSNYPTALKLDVDLARMVDRIPSDPRKIIMQRYDPSKRIACLYTVDVYTGEAVETEYGVPSTNSWYTQDGVAVLRFDFFYASPTVSIMGRAPGERQWKLIRRSRLTELERYAELDVVGATREPGILLVSHRADGENFKSIKKFDLRTMQIGAVVLATPDRDVSRVFTDERSNLVATVSADDRVTYQFSDEGLVRHFRTLEKHFDGECNVRLYDVNLTHDRFMLKVSGPRNPGTFYFYDSKTRQLQNLGEQQPWLTPERLAPMKAIKVKCRDGTQITAYLTTPVGAGGAPLPMVVMPHGGPEVRDHYAYDRWVQMLASRGWMVLQPNFRGSDGYGKAFADAGRKQWGDRMQEDVEDAVAQVVASGQADPEKLAIMGASYGGYAALMGVVRKPKLYRCAVGISGDYDLQQSLTFARRVEGVDSESYKYWCASMGDPKADKDMLATASPRLRVAEIAVPVLLIHGDRDTIVTPDSSRSMAQTLRKAGKTHEYVELAGVGHRGWKPATEKQVLTKSMDFIAAAFGQDGAKA